MVEIASNVKRNLKDRFENIKGGVRDEVELLKGAWSDVRERIVDADEPKLPKEYKVPGVQGGLSGTVTALGLGTIDNLEKHILESGKITRRWLR